MKEQIEKQAIEEMALELCRPRNIVKTMHHRTCGNCDTSSCDIYELCVDLYNAGYRKQSVGEWLPHKQELYCTQTIYHIYQSVRPIDWYCSKCKYITETQTPFCPNCGAKMKGGAE